MNLRTITSLTTGLALLVGSLSAQTRTTIVNNGPTSELYDIVILGDGYRSTEQTKFNADALKVATYFRTATTNYPYNAYFNCYNVHTVFRASQQSGADDPSVNKFVNTAYDASYGVGGTQRCLYLNTSTGRNQATADAALAPDSDGRVIVIVNDSQYGGCASAFACSYNGAQMEGVQAHEWGHSFGLLADEYDYGRSGTYTGSEFSQANVTNSATGNKWSQWLGRTGVNSTISAYQGARYYKTGVWRPETNCKMRSNGTKFCQICREQVILRFHQECTMIYGTTPGNSSSAAQFTTKNFKFSNRIATRPNKIEWRIDSGAWQNTGSTSFAWSIGGTSVGTHTITVRLTDTTTDVRKDPNKDLVHTKAWTVNVTSGTQATSRLLEVLPSDLANTEGNSATSYPFNFAGGLRVQYAYAGTTLDPQGPVTITGISFRPDGGTSQVAGATYDFTLDVSTASKALASLSSTFASNHGSDKARVYNGKLVIPAKTLGTGPHPFLLTVPFSKPFNWDPSCGPFLVDFQWRGITAGTSGTLMDIQLASTRGDDMRRLYSTSSPTATTGTFQNYGCPMALELDCDVAPKAIAAVEGNSSSSYPWNRTTKMRVQYVYDESTHDFSGRHKITRLGWRTNGGVAFGGRKYDIKVTLSTGTQNLSTSASTTFASNTGSDALTVFDGVWSAPATAAVPGGPSPFSVLVLDRPFEYDPSRGSLVVDLQMRSSSGSTAPNFDGQNLAASGTARVFNTTNNLAATGSLQTFGLAMCISAVPAPIVPQAAENSPGSGSSYPWNTAGEIRAMYLYEKGSLGTGEPVNITHLKWRPAANSGDFGPVTYKATIDLSTSSKTLASMSTTFNSNHGSNRRRLFSGNLSVPYRESSGDPAAGLINVKLDQPFRWDPSQGSLIVDIRKASGFAGGGNTLPMSGISASNVGRIGHTTNQNALVASFGPQNFAYALQLGGEGCNGQAIPFGSGCSGANGDPINSSIGLPWTGNKDFEFAVFNGAPKSIATVFFGLNKQLLNLGIIGLPACDLLVNTNLGSVSSSTDSNGNGSTPSPIPSNPSLHGATFYTQWICIDPSAPGGATLSNGIEIKVCH